MGHGHDAAASGESQAPLLAALAASIRANQDKEAQSGVTDTSALIKACTANPVHGLYRNSKSELWPLLAGSLKL